MGQDAPEAGKAVGDGGSRALIARLMFGAMAARTT
ncbi:hypothetical protein FHS42_004820 [Streptomyces zagrosensis]|uniref:Uncharacterized protein n=1 Tax=Streptomyces zagrosensis TaxID=1042984 RepID=A0A7W9QCH0_9ACTN|nr:hypothetical protein [Streptomyces zagrosensis]